MAILTTHVGSLPRPASVIELLRQKEEGEAYDVAAYGAAMDEAVLAAVKRQRDNGIDWVSDGEQGKPSYATYIKDRLTGFGGDSTPVRGADLEDFPGYLGKLMKRREGAIKLARPCCVGPIAVKDRSPLEQDIARFKAALAANPGARGFMNAASPGVIAVFQPNRHYASHEQYLAALADAMRDEYRTIIEAGLTLQVDCPDLAMGRHVTFKADDEATFLRNAEMQVEALNHALEGLPSGRLRLHLCWGNYEGPHHHDVPFAKLFSIVMKVRPRTLLFEAANPRHAHEWQVWRDNRKAVPDDMVLVPGVVSSTSNYIEHPELVAERLERFVGIVGHERVMAGSDCGFSTFAGDGLVDPDICYAKFAAMREGADIAARRLGMSAAH
jgi:5-methyltetrahydropteroyltriglutamate--homocysteine methyltransferase